MLDIKFVKAQTLKEKPDMNNLGFGKYFTDYMFIMDWDEGKGWHEDDPCERGQYGRLVSHRLYGIFGH